MHLFLCLLSWFLPYVGSLTASSVQALAFTALYSSLLPDERNDLLSQPVSDWTGISKPGQSVGLSIRTLASSESGLGYSPAVSQSHVGPPTLCSVSPRAGSLQMPKSVGFLSTLRGMGGRRGRVSGGIKTKPSCI